ncbi:unnamed protein product [Camellia sinensis]
MINPSLSHGKNPESKTEEDQSETFNDSPGAVLVNLLTSLMHLPPSMHSVADCSGSYLVGVVSLFPFDTEWMGREAYLRDPKGDISRVQTYDQGARAATFDFLLNSYSKGIHVIGGNRAIKIVSLVVFASLSLPLSVIYLYSCCKVTSCVPFYVTAELTADTGDDQV